MSMRKGIQCLFIAMFVLLPHGVLAGVTAVCKQEYVSQLGRQTMTATLKWDWYAEIVYPNGVFSASATGPTSPIPPFTSTFYAPDQFPNEYKVVLIETYPLPGIWGIEGTGFLYKANPFEIHGSGIAVCQANGSF
jgi:hypothetical protein